MEMISRKSGDEIVIDDTFRITVSWIRGDTVRLKIDGPSDMKIEVRDCNRSALKESAEAEGLKDMRPKE